ncbi:MAG TPA: hypothetical protein VHZ78_00550 [Rhizomicrobium sp.]|nr:hypothetical protein [Rhizomicrobium sp.]
MQLIGWSADRKRIVVLVGGQQDGDAYELFDRNTGAVTLIDNAYHGVTAADVAAVSLVTYAVADGRKLNAYLTLPNGRVAKNLPLVVLPHGGPVSRDFPGFDW